MLARILLLAVAGLLSACSTPPERFPLNQHQTGNTPIASSLDQALEQSTPIALQLDTQRAHKSHIDEKAPRVLINQLPSNYRTFSVQLAAGQPYNLHVISDCISCSGEIRYGLKPLLFLLDENGQVINDSPSNAYSGNRGATLRLTGAAPHTGTFFLLVAADNRELGQEIVLGSKESYQPETTRRNNSPTMRSYPVGEVRVYANSRS